jgi:peptidoglycan hydrolase-like protein with peptidoglycan-binding domain
VTTISPDLVERLGRISGPVSVSELADDDLLTLDEALVVVGYLDGGWSHDAATVTEALNLYRSSSGMAADGMVEPVLLVMLMNLVTTRIIQAATAKEEQATEVAESDGQGEPRPELKAGSSGPWVRYLQRLLVGAGQYYPSGITGTWDDDTGLAVENLQQAHGLEVTGIASAPTWRLLENSFEPWPDEEADAGEAGPADDVVMEFPPEKLITAVPTAAEAAAGRERLKELIFDAAHHDAQLFADTIEQWGYDWEPNSAFIKTAKENAEGWLTANPRKMVKGAVSWLSGILIETEYAQYKGRRRPFVHMFYGAVATGVEAGLLGTSFPERQDEFLTAASAGAWELAAALDDDDKHAIIAAAIAANDTLPTQLAEYQRRVYETGEVQSGVLTLIDGWDDIL